MHRVFQVLTNEVVRAEEVIVPDLHGQDGRQVSLSLRQTVEVILVANTMRHY